MIVAISLLLLVVTAFLATQPDPRPPPRRVCVGCSSRSVTAVVAGPYGHWLVDAHGAVEAFGDAHFEGALPGGSAATVPVTALAATPSGMGYWVVSSDGTVHAFGDAPDRGDTSALATTGSVAAIAPTPTGEGYWLATRAGAVLPFGDAQTFGDQRDLGRVDPIVGIVGSGTGKGYWLVTRAGTVLAFGDARVVAAATPLQGDDGIIGMAVMPSGKGYWLASDKGAVFAYGDAPFAGTGAGVPGHAIAITATATGAGYWIAFDTGDVRAFGDAELLGPSAGGRLSGPVVAMASTSRIERYRVPSPTGVKFDSTTARGPVRRIGHVFVTRDGKVAYDVRVIGNDVRVSSHDGGDGRMLLWPGATPALPDTEISSIWAAGSGDHSQPGHAHRVTIDSQGVHAITLTRNVWLKAGWVLNVHAWRHGRPYLIAQAPLPALRNVPYPWRVVSRLRGNVLSFKVWPAAASELAWGDSRWGGTAYLPDWYGIAATGRNGWYAGHLVDQIGAIDLRDLTVRALA